MVTIPLALALRLALQALVEPKSSVTTVVVVSKVAKWLMTMGPVTMGMNCTRKVSSGTVTTETPLPLPFAHGVAKISHEVRGGCDNRDRNGD